jgi:hypothetical protein
MGQYYSAQQGEPTTESSSSVLDVVINTGTHQIVDSTILGFISGSSPNTPKPTAASPRLKPSASSSSLVKKRNSSAAGNDDDGNNASELHVEFPMDLCECKVMELRELAAEHSLPTTGSKYELIGRLLCLFPLSKLSEESLAGFSLPDLKSMAKGIDIAQVGSKGQLISALLMQVKAISSEKRRSQDLEITSTPPPRTPQPPKRKRTDDGMNEGVLISQTELKKKSIINKRARKGSKEVVKVIQ